MAPKPTPVPTPKASKRRAAVELVTPAPVKKQSLLQLQSRDSTGFILQNRSDLLTETNSKLQENYVKLVEKTIEVCQDYELGIDIDDSIEA